MSFTKRQRFIALAAAVAGLVAPQTAGAISTDGAVTFQPSSQAPTVFQAYSTNGGSQTVVQLVDSTTGLTAQQIATVDGNLNSIGYYRHESVLVGLIDREFVSGAPTGNTPQLVSIDAAGTVTTHATVQPPVGTQAGTVLSYVGAMDGSRYYTLGLRAGSSGVPRVVVGYADMSAETPTMVWGGNINFEGSGCEAYVDAMVASAVAGSIPTDFVQDIVVASGTITSVVSGTADGSDYYFTMGADGSSPACTPMSANIPGGAGGVAYAADGSLVTFSVDDGSVWKSNASGSTKVSNGLGTGARGDFASNVTNVTAEQMGALKFVITVDDETPSSVDGFIVRATSGDTVMEFTPDADGRGMLMLPPGDWTITTVGPDDVYLDDLGVTTSGSDAPASEVAKGEGSETDMAERAYITITEVQAADSGAEYYFNWTSRAATVTSTTTTTAATTTTSTAEESTTTSEATTTTAPSTTTTTVAPTTTAAPAAAVSAGGLPVTGAESVDLMVAGIAALAGGYLLLASRANWLSGREARGNRNGVQD